MNTIHGNSPAARWLAGLSRRKSHIESVAWLAGSGIESRPTQESGRDLSVSTIARRTDMSGVRNGRLGLQGEEKAGVAFF